MHWEGGGGGGGGGVGGGACRGVDTEFEIFTGPMEEGCGGAGGSGGGGGGAEDGGLGLRGG